MMKILYVEDDPQDIDLTRRSLAESAPHFEVDTAESQNEAETRLAEKAYDLALIDLKLHLGDGLSLLAHIRERKLPIAVVIITGRGDEDSVVAALHAGADDYVIKRADYLARLPQTLTEACQRYQAETARKAHTLRVLYAEHNQADIDLAQRHLQKTAPHILLEVVNLGSSALNRLTNPAIAPYDLLLLDYRLPGMNALEVLKDIRQVHQIDIPVVLTTGHGDEETALQSLKLGAYDYIVKSEGYLIRLSAVMENAIFSAQLIREQHALSASETKFRTITEGAPDAIFIVDKEGNYTYANSSAVDLLGYSVDEFLMLNISDLGEQGIKGEIFQQLLKTGRVFAELKLKKKDGTYVDVELNAVILPNGLLYGSCRDLVERKREEKEKQILLDRVIKDANELEKRVQQRTEEYQTIINLTVGREIRMAELKKVIRKLRKQLLAAGMDPSADDPLVSDTTGR